MGAMSKSISSVRKLSQVLKVTGRRICPKAPMPEKGLLGWSHSSCTWRRLKAYTESTLRPTPPSMRVLVTATWQMVGVHSIGCAPEPMGLKG